MQLREECFPTSIVSVYGKRSVEECCLTGGWRLRSHFRFSNKRGGGVNATVQPGEPRTRRAPAEETTAPPRPGTWPRLSPPFPSGQPHRSHGLGHVTKLSGVFSVNTLQRGAEPLYYFKSHSPRVLVQDFLPRPSALPLRHQEHSLFPPGNSTYRKPTLISQTVRLPKYPSLIKSPLGE